MITDRNLVTRSPRAKHTGHSSLVTAVQKALKGGVKAVQLREKDLGTRDLLKLAYKMRDITKKHKAKLFVNDRVDIALAVDADGVHLTQNSIPADAVKKAVHASRASIPTACKPAGRQVTRRTSRFLIGVSTHSLKEAKEAEKKGADFITLGPVYRTPSKLKYGRPLGIDTLRKVCNKINIPVFAIGGVNKGKIEELKKAGAYGVAMISEVFGASDVQGKAEGIVSLLGSG